MLRFGVIGIGFGHGRAEAIKATPGAELVAVASRDPARARQAGEALAAGWHSDYRELLARPDIDAVAIYTPPGAHAEIAVAAARAGKHIVVTKPLATSLAEIDVMIEAADRGGVRLATEFMLRYQPAHYAFYRAVHDGALGELILGDFSEKSFRPQWYYDADGGWRAGLELSGGGTVMNQGIHILDQMCWLMGEVESVYAQAGAFTANIAGEDTAVATLRFRSGAVASFSGTTTFHNPKPPGRYGGGTVRRIELNGTAGTARLEDDALSILHAPDGAGTAVAVAPPTSSIFADMIGWIADERYDSPGLVRPAASRAVSALVLAIYRSARLGEPVRP